MFFFFFSKKVRKCCMYAKCRLPELLSPHKIARNLATACEKRQRSSDRTVVRDIT